MSLLSGFGFSQSGGVGGFFNKAQTNESATESSTVGAQDSSIALGPGATANFIDAGSVKSAFDFASDASRSATDLGRGAIDASTQAVLDSLSASGRVFDSSLAFAGDSESRAFDFGRNALDLAGTINADAVRSLETGFDKNAQILTGLANKVTLDSGERVQTVTQYVLVAVVALAAILIFGAKHAS